MERRLSLSGERFPTGVAGLDGIGLVRPEFLLRAAGEHITCAGVRSQMEDYLRGLIEDARGAPVWYRCTDLWSDEVNALAGVEEVVQEENPAIGLRGVRRHLRFQDSFRLEVEAVLSAVGAASNVHMLFPFVTDAEQFAIARDIVRDFGWTNRIGAMVEIPSAALCCEDLIQAGATNLLIGLNDLGSLTLGGARDHRAKLHPAVWALIGRLAAACGSVEWGVGGSMTPEILRRAEEFGVPYVTLHYAELPDLLGVDPELLPMRDFVAEVKAETRRRRAES